MTTDNLEGSRLGFLSGSAKAMAVSETTAAPSVYMRVIVRGQLEGPKDASSLFQVLGKLGEKEIGSKWDKVTDACTWRCTAPVGRGAAAKGGRVVTEEVRRATVGKVGEVGCLLGLSR